MSSSTHRLRSKRTGDHGVCSETANTRLFRRTSGSPPVSDRRRFDYDPAPELQAAENRITEGMIRPWVGCEGGDGGWSEGGE